ncbi:MAG: LTA synthase family protein [Barnesiella sp.]
MKYSFRFKFDLNIYSATLYQLVIAVLMMVLTRLFYYLYNQDLFAGIRVGELLKLFWGGVRFDLAAVFYLNLLFILLRILPFEFVNKHSYIKLTNIVYIVCNGMGIIMNMADAPFYRFTSSRTQWSYLLEFFEDKNAVVIFGGHLVTFWPVAVWGIFFIFLLIYLSSGVRIKRMTFRNQKVKFIFSLLMLFLFSAITFIGIRGHMRRDFPLAVGDAIQYVDNNRDISLVLNTPFTIIRSIGKQHKIAVRNYMSPEQVATYYNPVYTGSADGHMNKKNVFIIILEGIGSAFYETFNKIQVDSVYANNLMPFVDSLAAHSYVCTSAYAQGRRSVEGINSVLGGFPAFHPLIYMNSPYNQNKVDALPFLLKPEGYSSVFYCGCNKGSYAFASFSKAMGYDRFMGREDYGNDADFDGHWGIWDDKMAGFILKDLDQERTPFLASWFTITSHTPFNIPGEYKGKYRFPDNTMEQTVEYVNDVLETFFEEAKKKKWYENTLFVITSDHAFNMSNADYNSPNTLYRIPLIFYTPDRSLMVKKDSAVVSQIDITPSVLDILGYPGTRISLGNSVFNDSIPHFAVNYVYGLYQIMEGNYLLQFDGEKSVGLFDRMEDPVLLYNILNEKPDIARPMEMRLKAFLQEYTHRLVENRLSLSPVG